MTKEDLIEMIKKSEVPADYMYRFINCAEECFKVDLEIDKKYEEKAPTNV
ncbi:hypothetical protein [Rossellomorea vietnamensis]|nr:hypothetical protein [Rossellomorea vietnamensis]